MTGKMIVASAYGEARGVPALFSKELFGEITALKRNEGAKQLIAKHADDVATVCFPEGAVDVDTPGIRPLSSTRVLNAWVRA
jgi:molybdenum cofactor cytidylyltransferase